MGGGSGRGPIGPKKIIFYISIMTTKRANLQGCNCIFRLYAINLGPPCSVQLALSLISYTLKKIIATWAIFSSC